MLDASTVILLGQLSELARSDGLRRRCGLLAASRRLGRTTR
jgi:hypothetical protein